LVPAVAQFVERMRVTEHAQCLEHGRAADPERVDQLQRAEAAALGQALNDQALAVAAEQEVGEDIARAWVRDRARDQTLAAQSRLVSRRGPVIAIENLRSQRPPMRRRDEQA
jgi:hypothetical protein